MKLLTLYKRDTKGKVREWTIEVQDNKHRITTGLVDGKKVTTEWTICHGKNEGKANATTDKDQAQKEAEALHKKQTEKGYTTDRNDVDDAAVFGTMLAKEFDDYKDDLVYPVYSQPKLDGIRCVVNKDGMWTRNGKKIVSCPHIFEALKDEFEEHPDLIFDGELYNHDLKDNFNKIVSLVKKTKPTPEDLVESANIVKYYVYDCVLKLTFSERWTRLVNDLLPYTGKDPYDTSNTIVAVPTNVVHDVEALNVLYDDYVEHGYEGQMVRLDASYENKRSKNLLKRKEWKDGEWEILGVEEGEGNRTGTVGFMQFRTEAGRTFKSNVKGDFEYITELWRTREELVGKKATIKYFNLTPDGVPRFPYVIAIRDYE